MKKMFAVMFSAMMVLSAMVVFIGTTPKEVGANPNGWIDDERLTNATGNSEDNQIAVDSNNNVHIVWQDNRDGNWEIYYTKLDNNGNTIVDDLRLTSNSSSSCNPAIAIDSNNYLHIVWSDNRDENYEIYYTKLYNNGTTLIDDLRLTSDSNNSYGPEIVIDTNNYLHITWYDDGDGNWEGEIYYTKLDNNGNTIVNDLRLTNSNANSRNPKIAIDNNNYIHITWMCDKDGNWEIYYTKLDNNGNTIVDDLRLTNNGSESIYPYIAIDSNNYLHIVWSDNRDENHEIYYTKLYNNGTTLIDDLRLSNTGNVSAFPVINIDRNDYVYIMWNEEPDQIYYTKLDNNGNIVITDLKLTDAIVSGSTLLSIAIDDNNRVHVTWFDERDGNREIYYKSMMFSVSTNQPQYYQGDYVTLIAEYYNGNTSITFEVDDPNGDVYLLHNMNTDSNGTAIYTFKLPNNAELGTYTVYATTSDASANTTFEVIPSDDIIPTITSPSDMSIPYGSNGYSISWTANDTYPNEYKITRNGVQVQSGTWNNSTPITISLNGLAVGDYEFIITVNDTSNNWISDSVNVSVYMPHLIIKTFYVPSSVSKGATLTANITIENTFDISKNFVLAFQVMNANNEPITPDYNSYSINATTTADYQLQVNIPSDAPSGSSYFQILLMTGLPRNNGYTIDSEEGNVSVS